MDQEKLMNEIVEIEREMAVDEFDMVVFDPKGLNCQIFEAKYSKEKLIEHCYISNNEKEYFKNIRNEGVFMNKEWSELNKLMQSQLKKKDSFDLGIDTLLELRREIFQDIEAFRQELSQEDFSLIPFINAKGYHNKTIAYSLWHIFRIEDIVAHSLIANDEQVFFTGDYQNRILAPIITTGNELIGEDIARFSRELSIDELYQYLNEVNASTTAILKSISFEQTKKKVTEDQKQKLEDLEVVSKNENAYWLIDYWCNKDIRGLIQMPFSRHWIMHVEACLKIKNKIV